MSIPKTVFQTSINQQPGYVVNRIKERALGWSYRHFTDRNIIEYFINHPIKEFPFILNVFYSMKFGAHKADLFRYYFLYNEGGVFIDSDAMIQLPLDTIVSGHAFFSVASYIEGTVFQGFIGCEARHPIMYEALKDAYSINIDILTQHYHLLTSNMYKIIRMLDLPCHLYQELESDGEKAVTINGEGLSILIHYWRDKVIPLDEIPPLEKIPYLP